MNLPRLMDLLRWDVKVEVGLMRGGSRGEAEQTGDEDLLRIDPAFKLTSP